ncbi:BrnT family toxin [Bosea sp. CRIB-10]|uniref:BrnT family toxin n=1 Tax=Bosea sp. CRIB-10 TaxID=378404 RepID=UPI000B84E766|nr:BrnT family toxin [Bosea sp. CRIB-10]
MLDSTLYPTQFEWDEAKRISNIRKHGIDFITATLAFQDRRSFEYRSSIGEHEQRCVLIGCVEGRIIAVIYTVRNESIRLISARKARPKEREKWALSELSN